MPQLAANLSSLFTEVPFLDRFEAAAKAGFRGVEFHAPYDYTPAEILARAGANDVQVVAFDSPAGDAGRGELGLASLEHREEDFRRSIALALDWAEKLACPRIHVLAGAVAADDATTKRFVHNLQAAAELAARACVILLIEPISARSEPEYFLRTTEQAIAIIDRIAVPNVRLLLDLYHCEMNGEDTARAIRDLYRYYGHVQIAGVPERHEPDNERSLALLREFDEMGYPGWVGCEYVPRRGTLEGLTWAAPFGITGASVAHDR